MAQGPLVAGLIAGDALALFAALSSALLLRLGVPLWPGASQPSPETPGLIGLLAPLCLALFAMWGLYRPEELFCGHREYQRAAHACTYASFGILVVSFLLELELSRGALVLAWLLCCFSVCLERFLVRRAVGHARRRGRLLRRTLIVGADEHAVTIARELGRPGSAWRVLGFLDDFRPVGTVLGDGLTVLGDAGAATRLARELSVSDLVMVPHAVSWESQRDLLERAATTERPALHVAPGLYHLLATATRQTDGHGVGLVTLDRLRITGLDATLKAALDATLAVALLPLVGGLLALLRVAAVVSGGGPVLERRPVLGLRGRRFDLVVLAAAPGQAPAGLAWRLRATLASGRLGKLPNVLNVLRGRMSFVGPRAVPAGEELRREPWLRTLLLVRPGLTGPRLEGADGADSEEQAIRDVAYVRQYTLWLDLRLLIGSLGRVLRRQPALPAAYPPSPSEAPAPVEAASGR